MNGIGFLGSVVSDIADGKFGFNVLDIVIVFVFIFYAVEGYFLGFVAAFFDFVSFVLSFLLGLKWYGFAASFLVRLFSMPIGFANALGFFVTASVSEVIFNVLLRRIPLFFHARLSEDSFLRRANKIFGIFPGLASAFVLLSFLLTLVVSLPLSPGLKRLISQSTIGSYFVTNTAGLEKSLNSVFGGAINETLNFLTVEPQSNAYVALKFSTKNVKVDQASEDQMLVLINRERTKRGLSTLVMDAALRKVARGHSQDMFARGYFSHYTPESLSPFDRMASAGITYNYAGENLALAPNVELAMRGLMESPGHRANILSPNFQRVGIGIMDGGIYGEMFSQEFTD